MRKLTERDLLCTSASTLRFVCEIQGCSSAIRGGLGASSVPLLVIALNALSKSLRPPCSGSFGNRGSRHFRCFRSLQALG